MSKETDKLIQDWMREFDKSAFESGGKRWIKYADLTLDLQEYLQVRLNEGTIYNHKDDE